METSTPLIDRTSILNRGKQRRSIMAASPLRRSLIQTPVIMLQNVNDEVNDERERLSRRSIVDIQRRLSNIPHGGSPLNESNKFLGEQDMKDHFQICTKLFTENKITPKNAWKLHIIDLLKHMAQKQGTDTLQVAGTSLDISAKVYSIRVDDIHSDGLKLASSMSRVSDKQLPRDLDDNYDGDGDKENAAPKKKKKKKRLLAGEKNTICKDPKTLQAPLPKLDSVFFSTRTDAESSAIDNLFTNKLKMDSSGYKFVLLSNEKAWTERPDPVVQGLDFPNRKKYPLNVDPVLKTIELCAPFSDFQLDEWDPDEEEKQLASQKSTFMEKEQEVVFDENGVPIHELDGSIHDAFENLQNDVADDDIQSIHEIVAPQIRGDIAKIVEFRPDLTDGIHRSEYSYNPVITTFSGKLIDQVWAGPSHWKLKFIRRSSVRFSGQVTNQAKQAKGGRRRAQPILIDFESECEEIDMTKSCKVKKKPYGTDFNKNTLPIPDSSCAKLMDHVQELMTKPGVCPVKKSRAEHQLDYEVNTYNYENPNDSQYCSQHSDERRSSIHNDNDDYDDIEEHQLAQQEFLGENLVDAPEAIPRSYVSYALQAKKMDMKKLKAAVWQNLTNTAINVPKDGQQRDGTVVPTTFSKMFNELPDLLPHKMQKELSCSLAFVALLHLCNEQNLKLRQHPGYKDFDIEGPPERP